MWGIVYEREITICRSLFRSERCFLVQYIRGEILAWIVCFNYYDYYNYYLDKSQLTACIRFSARGFGCLRKISTWKLTCDFKNFLLKKLMECPVAALIESRLKSRRRFSHRELAGNEHWGTDWSFIGTLSQLVLSVKAKIYS